jgi:uncharacterized damage-inducible protein DinB
MPIVPDDKSWTWVLERVCPDCGFDATTFAVADASAAIEANALAWRRLLTNPRASERPNHHTWSATEYACHVRDVFRLYLYRLNLMLDQDAPQFENWDQDATAVAERYAEQGSTAVADELVTAAVLLADAFAAVRPDQLGRTGFRSDGAAFTVDTFIRYMVHDPVHHVWDVEQGYLTLGNG